MSTYSFYRLSDGIFTGTVAEIPAASLARHLRGVYGAKQGRYDSTRQRVDLSSGAVVDYVPEPPAPPSAETLWKLVRAERDRRLSECDWRVMRAIERGDTPPIEWLEYRQALRDVTKQDDPQAIRWPEVPE
ncbi:MAG: tail fiber assembly protein [Dehalococcoidia bacterium]